MPTKTVVVGFALGLGFGMVLASCSTEEQTDFSDGNRAGFMAACNLPLEDPQLVADVCECAFTRTIDELSFDRFEEVEEQLKENPEQPMPVEISEIIAECFIDEGDL